MAQIEAVVFDPSEHVLFPSLIVAALRFTLIAGSASVGRAHGDERRRWRSALDCFRRELAYLAIEGRNGDAAISAPLRCWRVACDGVRILFVNLGVAAQGLKAVSPSVVRTDV